MAKNTTSDYWKSFENGTMITEKDLKLLKNSVRIIDENETTILNNEKKYKDCSFDQMTELLVIKEKLEIKNTELLNNIKLIIKKL